MVTGERDFFTEGFNQALTGAQSTGYGELPGYAYQVKDYALIRHVAEWMVANKELREMTISDCVRYMLSGCPGYEIEIEDSEEGKVIGIKKNAS